MSHYDTLQVTPWAEDAVVRAAYRALMRLYHPDTNHDPQAELRVREITRAFAVLSDPVKRAVYDALPALGEKPKEDGAIPADQRQRPPMRNIGVASLAMALALTLATAVWWSSMSPRTPQEIRRAAVNAQTTHVAGAENSRSTQGKPVTAMDYARPVSLTVDRGTALPLGSTQDATSVESKSRTISIPKREIAQTAISKLPTPKAAPTREISQAVSNAPSSAAIAADRTTNSTSEPGELASCGRDSSKVAKGECTDDRQAQIERIATGFLNQSIEHADIHRQQLLLSARNRSASSRALCRSKDCVTEAYMRQIRDITEIMEGRIPTP